MKDGVPPRDDTPCCCEPEPRRARLREERDEEAARNSRQDCALRHCSVLVLTADPSAAIIAWTGAPSSIWWLYGGFALRRFAVPSTGHHMNIALRVMKHGPSMARAAAYPSWLLVLAAAGAVLLDRRAPAQPPGDDPPTNPSSAETEPAANAPAPEASDETPSPARPSASIPFSSPRRERRNPSSTSPPSRTLLLTTTSPRRCAAPCRTPSATCPAS
jgi:hypothetical protein